MLKGLLHPLESSAEFQTLIAGIKKGLRQQLVIGTSGSQSAYQIAGMIMATDLPVLVITHAFVQAQNMLEDLQTLLPTKKVILFPAMELLPYEVLAHSMELVGQRMLVYESLVKEEKPVIIAPIDAIIRRLPEFKDMQGAIWLTSVGDNLPISQVTNRLVYQGYERVEMIEGPGQFSIRGGIIDIFPVTVDNPLRIELFDDEVDSIRWFDIATQRSLEKLQSVTVAPARELAVITRDFSLAKQKIQEESVNLVKRLQKSGKNDEAQYLQEKTAEITEKLEQVGYFEGIDQLIEYICPAVSTIFDYLPRDSLICLENPGRLRETVDNRFTEWAETQTELMSKGRALPGVARIIVDFEHLLKSLESHRAVYFTLLPKQPGFLRPQNIVNLISKGIPSFLGRADVFVQDVRQWRKRGYPVVILAETETRCEKLLSSLKENKLDAFYVGKLDLEVKPGNIIISQGLLHAGFEQVSPKLVIATEKEIYGQRKKGRIQSTKNHGKIESFVSDLKPGDFVVHNNHGIGRYMGVQTMEMGGTQKDYLLLQYAGQDKLYVPTDQVNMVQKYLGAEGAKPKLNKLGGAEWSKVKTRVKESVQEMAEELIQLYASREALSGHAFTTDTVWQKEFEDSFSFEETPDQLRSIREIKSDMERRRPMDRLLCGDVGYGKTEVAIRAAFKAIMDGKQVAVLVPTTILAQQHYNTFRERFSGYPITVEMLSRFRTAKEQRETLKRLTAGHVDVVIGTHRLVQEDVGFRDLGLLIVDEEQRFGVGHKERLKQLKMNVDVLTLTATPIPRTLHMSLVGARDMSVLENPPEDRFPVQTYVLEYSSSVIADAISREVDRGGQVYFVHNRINDIEKYAEEIQGLLPEMRLAVAHGRMKEDQLERIVLEFIEGKYDVLLCTTIIETGLDIPNVNTIIINEAENMGLAQLYQLRGRVGRSNRLAYAYLTYRKDKLLTEVAEKRLQAIREFTEFGSGFKIAMRDLEIRGAGNILGPEQHGNMMSVGFDMYCRLLEDAVRGLQGDAAVEQEDPVLELVVDAYLDEEYISSQGTKMEVYKKIVLVGTTEEVDDLEEEIEDRFGDLPQAVRNLLDIARARVMCKQLFITNAGEMGDHIYLRFAPGKHLSGEKLVNLMQRVPGLKFGAGEILEIKRKIFNKSTEAKLRELILLLLEIKDLE